MSTLPAIAKADIRIDEGDSSSTFGAAVLLSSPRTDRVTADVTVVARTSALNRRGTVPVTFEPGQTCAVVRHFLAGDLSPSGRATSIYTLSITEPPQPSSGSRPRDSSSATATSLSDPAPATAFRETPASKPPRGRRR